MSNKLYKNDTQIIRVIHEDVERLLIIDCLKRTMPFWVGASFLNGWCPIDQEQLLETSGLVMPSISDLSQQQLKEMHLRFASISIPLMKLISDDERRVAIQESANRYSVSLQTIRHRLCDYLAFQDIAVLAPAAKRIKELSDDERNFRWALNKYFYNSKKLSLRQAYKYLIRDKYLDSNGNILQNCPKFHRFKYFYYKNRKESNYIISRWGRGEYDRNHRPLLGDSVRDFCPSIGYGMLDSTTCDIYLVNDEGELVGRPILTACVDGYTSMCLGYSIGWEGGINSLRKLMINVVSDKVSWCKRLGIEIQEAEWDCHSMPHKLITDMGSEYAGNVFSQLTDLGVELINLEPYRPELKSLVERFFGLIQESFKKELINKGVVLKDFGDRGAIDYRKNACLTLEQFERVIVLCIIHYNCGRAIELPYGTRGVKEHANCLWNACLEAHRDTLIGVNIETLRLILLPRCGARFKRDGLIVNRLRYRSEGYTDRYLKGGDATVAYDPTNVSNVWLYEDGEFHKFNLIESFFNGMGLEAIEETRPKATSEVEKEELESEIRLSNQIDLLAKSIGRRPVVKGLRKARQKEIKKGG